ncbi:hypothetical protein CDL12_14129 [Handroanthus impetiginosus]|uniref:Uncharacterized protein n=1 Tax=Handroanthus impetiginosus TaxID=429701 RepID=A0A2G9H6W4_9LAMI|nr:hypothetical protein CDL12_14129 [Handroanthus impetiginosus]
MLIMSCFEECKVIYFCISMNLVAFWQQTWGFLEPFGMVLFGVISYFALHQLLILFPYSSMVLMYYYTILSRRSFCCRTFHYLFIGCLCPLLDWNITCTFCYSFKLY